MKRLVVALVISAGVSCGKDKPTEPPAPSLARADSMHASIGDSVLTALPGKFSRCMIWSSLPVGQDLRYTLFITDSTGAVDSFYTYLSFPQDNVHHAWATIEEFYGPGNGIYAVLRGVNGECSMTAGQDSVVMQSASLRAFLQDSLPL